MSPQNSSNLEYYLYYANPTQNAHFFRQIVSVVVHCNDIHDFIIKAVRQLFLATGFDEMMLINEAINIFGRLHIEIVVSRIISFSLQKRVSMVFLRCIGDESSSKICVCHQTRRG